MEIEGIVNYVCQDKFNKWHTEIITNDKPNLMDGNDAIIKYTADDVDNKLRGLTMALMSFLAKEQGVTKLEMYHYLLFDYGWFKETIKNGIVYRELKPTVNGTIDNKHMSDFLNFAERTAIERGYNIIKFIDKHNEIRKMNGKV